MLESDRDTIFEFNNRVDKRYKLECSRLPEPFIGNSEAPVVLLNINPKYVKADTTDQINGIFADACRNNWSHKPAKYPFYYFDPELQMHPGYNWWKQKLGDLLSMGPEKASEKLFAIEFCPYPSKNAGKFPTYLNGDKYRNYLVEKGIRRGAAIIIMQGASRWYRAIPELKEYKNVVELRNPQNSCISATNLCRPITKKYYDETFMRVSS